MVGRLIGFDEESTKAQVALIEIGACHNTPKLPDRTMSARRFSASTPFPKDESRSQSNATWAFDLLLVKPMSAQPLSELILEPAFGSLEVAACSRSPATSPSGSAKHR